MDLSSADQQVAQQVAKRGAIATAASFFIWGLMPLYLKPLHAVPVLQISAWRFVMACLFAFGGLAWRGELHKARLALTTPSVRWRVLLSGGLLAVNWTTYAWGVAQGAVLTTSLGYFINPLVNVVLGVLVLSERLNSRQWLAVTIAAGGVALLTIESGQVPWLALVIACTFSFYGLIRKTVAVEALPGLAAETLMLTPVGIAFLCWRQTQYGDVIHHSPWVTVLLLLSGLITAVPLVLFAYGARRISYATVGMLQYIGPTLQFILGLVVFKETLEPERLICFVLIWTALVIYAGDSVWRSRAARALA